MGGEEEMGIVEVMEVMGGEGEACTCIEAEGGRRCVDGEGVEVRQREGLKGCG